MPAHVVLVDSTAAERPALERALWASGYRLTAVGEEQLEVVVGAGSPDVLLVAEGPAYASCVELVRARAPGVPVIAIGEPGRTLERLRALAPPIETVVASGGVVDLEARTIARPEGPVTLSAVEASLLRYLAAHPGIWHSTEELLERVWGYRRGVRSTTVTTTLHRLRSKIEADPAAPRTLVTRYGGGLRFVPEPEPAAATPRLPAPRDGFVGGDARLARVRDELANARIVTLIGPPGVGKTRTALELARTASPSEAVWVGASTLGTREGVVAAVAAALDWAPPRDVVTLVHALRGRLRTLLVLDECENVTEVVAGLVSELADGVPDLRVLATSRRPLGVVGEVRIGLEPLPVPTGDALADVVASEAVALLRERARAAGAPLEVDEANASQVARLVRRVDGLPLAIELLAARLRFAGPDELGEELAAPLDLLRSAEHGRTLRHVSVEGAIAASWARLSDAERSTLAQLSVFEGGWTRESAVAVVRGPARVTEALETLVDHSLVRPSGDLLTPQRFEMLALIRSFASRELDRSGGREATERAYVAYFAALEGRDGDPVSPVELVDILAAARGALVRSEPELAGRCAVLAARVVAQRGPFGEVSDLFDRLEPHAMSRELRLRCATSRARTLVSVGRIGAAIGVLAHALTLADAGAEPAARGEILVVLGSLLARTGQAERAAAVLAEAQALCAREGLERSRVASLRYQAALEFQHGDLARASELLHSALAVASRPGFEAARGATLAWLADVEREHGRWDDAVKLKARSAALLEAGGDLENASRTRLRLAFLYLATGAGVRAQTVLRGELDAARRVGSPALEADCFRAVGTVAAALGQLDEAEAGLTSALERDAGLGRAIEAAADRIGLGELHLLRGQRSEARGWLEAAEAAIRPISLASPALSSCLQALALTLAPTEPERAARLADEAVGLVRGFPTFAASARMARARVAVERHRLEEAERDLAEIPDGLLWVQARGVVRCLQARLLHHRGASDQAWVRWREASVMASELGAGARSELGDLLHQTREALEVGAARTASTSASPFTPTPRRQG